MISSTPRKLYLSGWLKANSAKAYSSALKLQKFLWFYEAFSKVNGDEYEFDHLRGYKNGPCFSHVYGDRNRERYEFEAAIDNAYADSRVSINEMRARKCAFIVSTLSTNELSELTHKMHIWNAQKPRIDRGEQQVSLLDCDFDDGDFEIIQMLNEIYTDDLVIHSHVLQIGSFYFVFNNIDSLRIQEEHKAALK